MSNSSKLNYLTAIFWIVLFSFLAQPSMAHGDLDDRILAASEEINSFPDSAYLYLKRGALYYQHEEFAKAIVDLKQVRELGYEDLYCDLVFAQSYFELENYEEALLCIHRIESKNENHVNALKVKAKIFFKQKRYEESARIYEAIIGHSRKTFPVNYIDASKAWELSQHKNGIGNATRILEKGMEDLAPLFVLLDRLLSIYLSNHNFEKALETQNRIIESANRKELAYQKGGEIALQMKDTVQAKKYFEASLQAIQQLPIRIQQSKKITALSKKLTLQLSVLTLED